MPEDDHIIKRPSLTDKKNIIIERMDNVEDMPEWLQQAFHEGRVYHRCKEMYDRLTSERDEAREEVEQYKRNLIAEEEESIKLQAEVERWKKRCIAEEDESTELHEKLAKYGRHLPTCARPTWAEGESRGADCTCGLEDGDE